jgi:TolA-binding protein
MKSKNTPPKSVPQATTRQSDTVMSQVSSASTELSLSDLKTVATKKKKENSKKQNAGHTKKKQSYTDSAKTTSSPLSSATHKSAETAGQKLFEAAVKAYRKDDCRTALELLDRYLAENSGSPLAADANLYKAECYLKLSAQ